VQGIASPVQKDTLINPNDRPWAAYTRPALTGCTAVPRCILPPNGAPKPMSAVSRAVAAQARAEATLGRPLRPSHGVIQPVDAAVFSLGPRAHPYGLSRADPGLIQTLRLPQQKAQHVLSFDVSCQVHFWPSPTLLRSRLPLNGTA